MSQKIENLAIMFADICGSTALYNSVGDEHGRYLTSWCINTMIDEITSYRGVLIKLIGDEILCTFPNAKDAFNAACAMQNAIRDKRPADSMTMHIRIGFHYGKVICENDDVFGDTVNVAARVAGSARSDQIMITQDAYNALPPVLKHETHQVMSAEFKGKQEKYPIYLVVWEQDYLERTCFVPLPQRHKETNTHVLTLSYNSQIFKINAEQSKSIILGRANDCDIIVNNGFASRQHARVEFRFEKFYIVDQSTNGTFIRFKGAHVVHITREEKIIQSTGSLSLGQNNFEDAHRLIEFSIV